jgi:hypothetical protein
MFMAIVSNPMKRSNKTKEMHHAYVINIMFIPPQRIEVYNNGDIYMTHPKLFDKHSCESKNKTIEQEGVGVCSLVCSTSEVEKHAGVLRWILGQVTSSSIIHMNLHKPNNKLVSM